LKLINQAIVFYIFPVRPLLDVCSSVPKGVQKVAHGFAFIASLLSATEPD